MKPRPNQNNISALEDKTETVKNSQADLENMCHEFYAELYQARAGSIQFEEAKVFTLEGVHNKLMREMQQVLSKEITLEELSHALASMARGKALGPDGILVEFYQCM